MEFLDIINQTKANNQKSEVHRDPQKSDADLLMQEQIIASYTLYNSVMQKSLDFDFITPDHFSDPFFAGLFNKCVQAGNSGERLSFLDIESDPQFKKDDDTAEFLRDLAKKHSAYSFDIVKSFAYDLDEYYKFKQIKQKMQETLDSFDTYRNFNKIKNSLETLNQDIAVLTHSPFALQTVFTHQEAIANYKEDYSKSKDSGIPTGIKTLDDIIGGFLGGELIILAARPSMGKTAVSISMAANASEAGFNVMNFSLEMMNNQNMSRFVSRDSYIQDPDSAISYSDLSKKRVDERIAQSAIEFSQHKQSNILHDYTSGLSASAICSKAEQYAHQLRRDGKRLDVIFIDYLQVIDKTKESGRTTNDITGSQTWRLKNLAKKLNVPVVLLSQLNRECEKEKEIMDKRPAASHLRDSGSIEQDADMILCPFRPSQYEINVDADKKLYRHDYMEIAVLKQRQGQLGIAKIKAKMAYNYLESGDQNDSGMTDYGLQGIKENSNKSFQDY